MMRTSLSPYLTVAAIVVVSSSVVRAELFTLPKKPVDSRIAAFHKAVESLHARAARSRSAWREEDLRKKVSSKYLGLEKRYEKLRDPRKRARALAELALVYAELAWVERIEPLRAQIAELDADLAARLGSFAASKHFVVRVVGVDPKWGKSALDLAEAARAGYLELFGFSHISKVPGKKVRILIHVDPSIEKSRLFFHPTPMYHSELRYEMPDEKYLTLAGQRRIVYGFCHELGHMVAMWGKYREVEDDKHAWAHYTGCLVVEKVYDRLGNEPWPTWTSYQRRASGVTRLRKQIDGKTSGVGSYDAILTLFHTIGAEFGTDVYGKCWVWRAKKKRFRRLNNVPYLWLNDLRDALLVSVAKKDRARVVKLFGR